MKISATIQARTGSTRLPKKVLLPILGEPMLSRQVERIQRSMLIDEVIISTTTNPEDDPIEKLAQRLGVLCFRGSEDDVLGRVVSTLKNFKVETHVSFCGDCPLPDPTIIDMIIGVYLKNRHAYDYVSTSIKTTFPPGLDLTVYPAEILYDADSLVGETPYREYVSIHIESRRDRYRILNVEAPPWCRYPDLYLEVDTAEDFKVVTAIYEALYPSNPCFVLLDVIEFMKKNPALAEINRNIPRPWKEFREDD